MLTEPKIDNELVLSSASYPGVGAHGERDYDMEIIVPPDSTLPDFTKCKLFEMWCSLKVSLNDRK